MSIFCDFDILNFDFFISIFFSSEVDCKTLFFVSTVYTFFVLIRKEILVTRDGVIGKYKQPGTGSEGDFHRCRTVL